MLSGLSKNHGKALPEQLCATGDAKMKESAANRKTSPGLRILWSAVLLFTLISGFFTFNNIQIRRTLNSISLKNGSFTNKNSLKVTFHRHGIPSAVRFMFNGEDVTGAIRYEDNKGTLELKNLQEGSYRLIAGTGPDMSIFTFWPNERIINITVDTKAPSIALTSPESELARENQVLVAGSTEPRCAVLIEVNDKKYKTVSDRIGSFFQQVPIESEVSNITVKVTDRAGNSSMASRRLVLDESPPVIAHLKPEVSQILTSNTCTLESAIHDTGSGLEDCWFVIDGRRIDGKYDPRENTLTAVIENLDEGLYEVEIFARDKAGWESSRKISFTVDSTDEPGLHNLRPGARGGDVKAVQQQLSKLGYLEKSDISGLYDSDTANAVMEVQKKRGIAVTGITDRETIMAISNKIFVYLNEFALYLVSPEDQVLKRYPIACGSPYYPTPPGFYHVREKVYHPSWYPPPSPWARGAKPQPPGPGNPLGTRWIGLNSDILGIHGTPSDWSIGTAASHGCIRMHIYQVEELFEMVNVGTPVSIFSSRPEDHKKIKTDAESKDSTTSAYSN